jgi:hypothetical protein
MQIHVVEDALSVEEHEVLKSKCKEIQVSKPLQDVIQDLHAIIGIQAEPPPTDQDNGLTSKPGVLPDESAETTESIKEEEINEMFERLQVLDIGEVKAVGTNKEIEIREEKKEVEIITSSSWSHQIDEIIERAKTSCESLPRQNREWRRKNFGEDFVSPP